MKEIYKLSKDPANKKILRRSGMITLKILEIIGLGVQTAADVVNAMLSAGYGASYGKISREMDRIEERRLIRIADENEKILERQRYYSMINYLKRDGILKVEEKDGKRVLMITDKGKQKSAKLRNIEKEKSFPSSNYCLGDGGNFVMIAFDVPERDRKKRAWLRFVLNNMGLRMAQKSVWIGKGKIPGEFIQDIAFMKLTKFVEIFEITKTGTLRSVGDNPV